MSVTVITKLTGASAPIRKTTFYFKDHMTNLIERELPKDIERKLRALGIIVPHSDDHKDPRFQPIDQWWKRGEECPH